MGIKKRAFPVKEVVVKTAAEPRQLDDQTLVEFLRDRKAKGLRDCFITIPIYEQKYGMIPVSIDELIKLAEKPLLTLPKEKRVIKPKPKPAVEKLKLSDGRIVTRVSVTLKRSRDYE